MTITWWDKTAVLVLISSVTDVIYGVRFTAELSDKVAVLDQSLLWNCEAEDDANIITYGWTFNGAGLPLNENQVIYSNGSLLIRRVSNNNVGTYLCLATAGESTVYSRSAKLEIAYINPTFLVQPISHTVILGDNVVLSCYIESLPLADVAWTLNGKNVSSGTVTQDSNGTSTLTLYPVMYYDVGTYKCVGTNPLTGVYRYSYDASLVVRGQPVFLSSLKPVSVPLGYQAAFVCYFHGNPEPGITWFVHYTSDGGSVTSKEVQNSDKYMVYDNGTFIINNVTKDDEAFYTCNVGNSFGEMSESAMLTVTGPATPPEFTFKPSNNTVQQGDSVMFLCTCSGNPESTETWEKASSVVSENGSLSISEVQSEDTGWYTCLCENDVGTVSQTVYLDVYTLPVINRSIEDVAVKKGAPISLHCSATGNPSPSISWLTPGFGSVVTSVNGATLNENGSLYITLATLNDTGEYTCLARNIVGMVTVAGSVTVKVAPVMTLLPLSQGVKVGSRVYLHCQANGVPDPVYSWSKDNEGVILSTSRRQIYLNNTLVIHSVMKQDDDVYRCVAGNDLGVTQAVATITVTVPPIFTTVPNNKTVKMGSSAQLSCVADGDPVPTQKWTKDDRQLILDNNMELSLDQSILTISEIRLTQFGKYTCIASNIAGTESVSAWLKVYDKPVFSAIPEDTIVSQSATLTLLCQGQAIEAPSVTWFKRREGEMTQLVNNLRVNITDSGYLQIKSVEQQRDEGWYTCVVRNSAAEISKDVYVDVQVPPKILSTNSPQSAFIQSEVILTCQSTGDPAPTLQWINPSGHVITPNSSYQVIQNTLRILAVNEKDLGDWTCKYCNQLGCDRAFVQLNIEGLPTIESFSGMEDGTLVTIECIAQGNPAPSVTFTTEGQSVTSAFQGHMLKNNRILIESEYLKKEYRCLAENVHGTTFKTISVPSTMETPTALSTESGKVTLSWKDPFSLDKLPLSGYSVQMKSKLDVSWQPVQGYNLLNQRSLEVTGLESNKEYIFRIAARNLLGLGEYSDESSWVITQSGVPSPPQDVLALQIDEGVVVLTWEKSQNLNAPIVDVVYEYVVVKPTAEDSQDTEVIHTQGTLMYNQTYQVEISDLTEPVIYRVSLWARNIKLNQSSEPVVVVLDMTSSGYLEPEPHADNSTFGRDKVIAIVAGSFGGIIVVIIIVFVVTRARNQRKSKSLSLLDHRLSLDQFYMENPKTLFKDDKYSSKRKSGHSFYSFDESFHSTMGTKGRHDGSVEFLGSSMSNDVLLLSRSPLYKDGEVRVAMLFDSKTSKQQFKPSSIGLLSYYSQRPISQTSSKEKLYNENIQETACIQSEIELPACDITIVKGDVNDRKCNNIKGKDKRTEEKHVAISNEDNDQKVTIKELEDDVLVIYSSMQAIPSEQDIADQSVEHIYTSIHSSENQSSSSTKSSNSGQQKPLLRVVSPDNDDSSKHTVNKLKLKDKSVKFCDKLENSGKDRCTKSASPGLPAKGSDSNKPKPPVRVLSLDLLSPSVKTGVEKYKDLKLLSDSMVKKKNNVNKRYKKKAEDYHEENERNADSAIEHSIHNGFHDPGETSNSVVNTEYRNRVSKDIQLTPLKADTNPAGDEILSQDYEDRIHYGLNGHKSVIDGKVDPYEGNIKLKPKPKNVLDDNFLTDAEIKEEVVSAALY